MNLFLYWPPWSWKSTVGRALALNLSVPHYDSDTVLRNTHWDIWNIITTRWEAWFRDIESTSLSSLVWELSQLRSNAVISLGWWTLLREENRRVIELSKWRIITLIWDWNLLWERIRMDWANTRPLAQDYERFITLMRNRALHYQNFYPRIPIDGKSPEQIVNDIKWLFN